MSKIKNAFDHKKAFIGFLTAGDPSAQKTIEYILTMEQAGADLIEIGIPFSDPVAEGPTIQAANLRALSGGMTTGGVFEIVKEVRRKSNIPLVLLTYLNPVFRYGYEQFFSRCGELGVDGVIIPDMPYEEKGELSGIAASHGVDVVSLIAPTSQTRIRMIAKEAAGFIYVVSSMGVTGIRKEITTDLLPIVNEIRKATNLPAAIGFGINTPEQAENAARIFDGVIVGSAIVKIIGQYGDQAAEPLFQFVRSMKEAVKKASV
ncbi:MAG: tryptophan synthase subunit alpha [Christensenellales bacterium]